MAVAFPRIPSEWYKSKDVQNFYKKHGFYPWKLTQHVGKPRGTISPESYFREKIKWEPQGVIGWQHPTTGEFLPLGSPFTPGAIPIYGSEFSDLEKKIRELSRPGEAERFSLDEAKYFLGQAKWWYPEIQSVWGKLKKYAELVPTQVQMQTIHKIIAPILQKYEEAKQKDLKTFDTIMALRNRDLQDPAIAKRRSEILQKYEQMKNEVLSKYIYQYPRDVFNAYLSMLTGGTPITRFTTAASTSAAGSAAAAEARRRAMEASLAEALEKMRTTSRLQREKMWAEMYLGRKAAKKSKKGGIFGVLGKVFGTILGGLVGGPAGAAIGGTLGGGRVIA